MNVLFLNNGRFAPIMSHTMYSDLMREFKKREHRVYIVSANEKRFESVPEYYVDNDISCVCVRIGNLTKCSMVEKAITMMTISRKYINGIKKYYSGIKFDLIIYPTPPISLLNVVKYVKKRDGGRTYLLLKDIFPQNAVDIGLLKTRGIKGLLYRHYRKKEKKLYQLSDDIGCMSQANVDYVIKNNPEIFPHKVEICPNCLEVRELEMENESRMIIRDKYNIPRDKTVFVYGGNLGKPQGIPFLIECLNKCKKIDKVFFLIVGDGTEYHRIEDFLLVEKPGNVELMKQIPREDYDKLVCACDIGLLFLDHRFTIPNFPSRLLAYMQAKLPVLAVTDSNTDVGKVIVDGGFGWWCESNDSNSFMKLVERISKTNIDEMKKKSFEILNERYTSNRVYNIIVSHCVDS